MKKIILGLLTSLLFIGCSSNAVEQNVKPSLVVGSNLELTLNNQHEKAVPIPTDTKKVIFAFSKDGAHICNDYFTTKSPNYLANHNTLFVADVSTAPSLIRSMFIMPGLKDFKHTVLILNDKVVAAPFRKNMDAEKIVVVTLNKLKITAIKTITSEKELIAEIEAE